MTERSWCSQRARAPGTPVQRVATPFTLVVRSIVRSTRPRSINVMGLIARLRRWYHLWVWRLRYWWYDTPSGVCAQHWALGLGVLVLIVQLVRVCVATALPAPHGAPAQAVYWWVWQLAIAVVAAYVSAALRPKPEPVKPQQAQVPTVQDGQAVKHHFGTVWVGDEFILAWKMQGTIPIKTKGGKK